MGHQNVSFCVERVLCDRVGAHMRNETPRPVLRAQERVRGFYTPLQILRKLRAEFPTLTLVSLKEYLGQLPPDTAEFWDDDTGKTVVRRYFVSVIGLVRNRFAKQPADTAVEKLRTRKEPTYAELQAADIETNRRLHQQEPAMKKLEQELRARGIIK